MIRLSSNKAVQIIMLTTLGLVIKQSRCSNAKNERDVRLLSSPSQRRRCLFTSAFLSLCVCVELDIFILTCHTDPRFFRS